MRQYIKTIIVEPFPLFYSHVSHPQERKRETAKGPFYQAGSSDVVAMTPENYQHALFAAQCLREDGWTVLVTTETRN